MIIVASRRNNMTVRDMFSDGYVVPRLDKSQDVRTERIVGTHVNGVLRYVRRESMTHRRRSSAGPASRASATRATSGTISTLTTAPRPATISCCQVRGQ